MIHFSCFVMALIQFLFKYFRDAYISLRRLCVFLHFTLSWNVISFLYRDQQISTKGFLTALGLLLKKKEPGLFSRLVNYLRYIFKFVVRSFSFGYFAGYFEKSTSKFLAFANMAELLS